MSNHLKIEEAVCAHPVAKFPYYHVKIKIRNKSSSDYFIDKIKINNKGTRDFLIFNAESFVYEPRVDANSVSWIIARGDWMVNDGFAVNMELISEDGKEKGTLAYNGRTPGCGGYWNKDWKYYRKISAVIIILAALNPLVFVQITKVLCGRIRFNNLAPGDYTPWFLPPGPLSGGDSFPSGHTSVSFMFLPLLIILRDRKLKDPIRILSTILILGWAIFIGLSRVIIGEHYASDVLFSAMMACIITILLYKRFYLKGT